MGKMPVLFVGHGSPMNAVEDNKYTKGWEQIAAQIPAPEAILCISAHWYTEGTRITDVLHPRTVYDMYGFPDELYRIQYSADGAPELAHETRRLIRHSTIIDNTWGIDHGTWSVLWKMYPKADIPVYQLSIDADADPKVHYQIGNDIAALRDKGVLIMGSGNVVHNLGRISWGMEGGQPWAEEFDSYIRNKIEKREFEDVIDYKSAGKSSELAFHTPDHFLPLLYVLGASTGEDNLTVFNDSCTMGSMSMTSYLFA